MPSFRSGPPTAAETFGAYLKPGMLCFVRQGSLVARRLDLSRGEVTGDPVTLADPVSYQSPAHLGGFSVSADGRIAYRMGITGQRQLTWFDRRGKVLGAVGEPDRNDLYFPELSPDGQRVAVQRRVQNNIDVWLMDVVRGGFTRLTLDAANDHVPLWSPDGLRIAFCSNRKGAYNLYVGPSRGAGAEELLPETTNDKFPEDWSKDGRFLLYQEHDPKTGTALRTLEMTGTERRTRVVVDTPSTGGKGKFSPDGRWVAYETDESGRFEIVVQAFPEPDGKWSVSTSGGSQPRWSHDGKELYFIAPDRKLMAARVTVRDATFEVGTPAALFLTPAWPSGSRHQYAVSRDGRFLINQPMEESTTAPITLILNWKP